MRCVPEGIQVLVPQGLALKLARPKTWTTKRTLTTKSKKTMTTTVEEYQNKVEEDKDIVASSFLKRDMASALSVNPDQAPLAVVTTKYRVLLNHLTVNKLTGAKQTMEVLLDIC